VKDLGTHEAGTRRDSVLRPVAAMKNSIATVPRSLALSALTSAAGAVLLLVAEFLTLREIRTVTVVPPGGTVTGGSHHAYALALVAVVLLAMAYGAARGARPAAVALVVLALVAVFVVVVVDRPTLDDTGLIGRTYDLAEARPGPGFYVESLGAALALIGAVATLVLRRPARPRPHRQAA
jgi:hypothetical protein